MVRTSVLLCAATLLLGAFQVMAADTDLRTCALSKAYECSPEDGCKAWSIQEMGLPRFVRIDLKAKSIVSLDQNVHNNSNIASIERVDGVVVMHGTERRGWSIAVGEVSGDLTLSASGDGDGFIVFGSCISP